MPDLQGLINESDHIVFFGGAGVSTESGLPDFRSIDGLYSQKFKYPPETMLSHDFFYSNTADFYTFYKEKMLVDCLPNPAHYKLAELEQAGKLKAVVTQNIDGLHQSAGSVNVVELHGSVHRNYCINCDEFCDLPALKCKLESESVPHCDKCGAAIKPDVVLYGEPLDTAAIDWAVMHISKADMLIVGGTSLAVYPAAGLLNHYEGNKLVLINMDETQFDSRADLLIRERIGEVLNGLTK